MINNQYTQIAVLFSLFITGILTGYEWHRYQDEYAFKSFWHMNESEKTMKKSMANFFGDNSK